MRQPCIECSLRPKSKTGNRSFRPIVPKTPTTDFRGLAYLADQEKPDIEHARAIWEQDRWDPDAKAWRETSRTIEWEKERVQKTERAVEDWYRHHPIKALLVRAGIQGKPRDLESLEQEHHQAERFLAGSQNVIEKIERSWTPRQPEYEQKLESQGRSIEEAREKLEVIEKHPEHFKEVFEREHNQLQERIQQKMSRSAGQRGSRSRSEKTPDRERESEKKSDRDRGHDRDDGWSR